MRYSGFWGGFLPGHISISEHVSRQRNRVRLCNQAQFPLANAVTSSKAQTDPKYAQTDPLIPQTGRDDGHNQISMRTSRSASAL